jgi:uncharacterized repeat protein (TIGR01451 family)
MVESKTSDVVSLAQAIAKLGGEVGIVASDQVSALVPIPALDAIASLPDVAYVRLPSPDDPDGEYFRVRTLTLEDGTSIDEIVINGPPTPPPGYDRSVAQIPDKGVKLLAVNTLSNVPAFNWSFGCSATSAAMIAGYYDRTAYPNVYTGPTNGGVMPMDNSSWPDWFDGTNWRHQCPLSATHNGLDGRATNGHVDDYWVSYGSGAPDPFIGHWPEHTYGDCTGDYMKTNQYNYDNTDGATTFYNYTNGAPLYWYNMEAYGIHIYDGGYGIKLFYESRGYTVDTMYNQYIYGYNGNTQGFTYTQYKAEIDAGRPVMIHVVGHTMVGFGYDDASNLMYIHDTWNYNDHTMTWGGYYAGMLHYAVTIVQLAATGPCTDPPTTPDNPSPADNATDISINTDLSWSGGHPCPGESVTYDVYLEANDSNPDNLICNDVSSTTCDPGTLSYNTHYYWQVVANGLNGPTTGPVWDFTTEEAGADLTISKTDEPDPVIPGTSLTYTISVTNTGPLDATGVVVTDTLPLTVTFASSSASQGTCSGNNVITCNLGTINNGAIATVTIVVTPTASGTFTNTASVTSGVTDPNTANNNATASTTACYDFNGNGAVDVGDIQLVASRWRCQCGDDCYDPLYDLDHDCDIDIVDIMFVTARWGETC